MHLKGQIKAKRRYTKMGNKSSLMLHDEEIKQISEETGFSPTQIEKLFSRFAHLDRSNCGSLNKNDLMSIPELAINPLCERLIQMFFADCDEDERINFKQFMRVLATFKSNNNHITSSNNTDASLLTVPFDQSRNRGSRSRTYSRNSSQDPSSALRMDRNNNSNANTPVMPRLRPSNDEAKLISSNNDININTIGSNNNVITDNNNISNNNNNTEKMNEGLRNKLAFVFRIYDADDDGRISFDDLRSILKMMVGNYIEEIQLDKIATRALVEIDEDNDGFIEFNEFCKVFSGKDLDDKLRVKFLN